MKSSFLGEQKISKLLFSQAFPATLGMLIMSLYNIVDTIYIGRGVGTLALAGVSVSIPFIMTFLAVSMTLGIGAASIISRSLGAHDFEKVKHTYGNYISLLFIFSLLMTFVGYIFLSPIMTFIGATSDIFDYAIDYARIILLGSVLFLFISSANNIIRASGHAKFAMTTMFVGAIINLILDPIFIFYFKMGVRGAAYATVLSWVVSSMYVLYYYFKINQVKINFIHLKLQAKVVKEIFMVGASSFARQISVSIMTIVVNTALARFGTSLALATFGIISRLTMLTMMPVFGVVQGMQPIVGYNWGAKKYLRVKETLMLSIKAATIIALVSFSLIIAFPNFIASVFTNDQELIELTSASIKIVVLMFPTIGLQLVAGGLYQSLGKARPAFFLSILRQLILLVPFVFILPVFFKLSGVWYAFPLSDLLAFLITLIYIYKELHIINDLILEQAES